MRPWAPVFFLARECGQKIQQFRNFVTLAALSVYFNISNNTFDPGQADKLDMSQRVIDTKRMGGLQGEKESVFIFFDGGYAFDIRWLWLG
ncbi:hypothetical protein [Paenibacillus sp. J2TS4]|uniref:hypothetical protein n=1 Tax=Paenibacillus sp. J2TS4 TaxID=2807194 RepID=UPI001B072072|nr:hypothetical protein [Paenibacillus sp. J2TS4]GIP34167.1 hypothetical protein J2TS4_33770 [Paenibacillus sp. J2TS4]